MMDCKDLDVKRRAKMREVQCYQRVYGYLVEQEAYGSKSRGYRDICPLVLFSFRRFVPEFPRAHFPYLQKLAAISFCWGCL
jgi:hypothetical protein